MRNQGVDGRSIAIGGATAALDELEYLWVDLMDDLWLVGGLGGAQSFLRAGAAGEVSGGGDLGLVAALET